MLSPFKNYRVNLETWHDVPVDLVAFYEPIYKRLCELIASARQLDGAIGILLNGDSGSGKTHLMRRMATRMVLPGRQESGCHPVVYVSFCHNGVTPIRQLRNAVEASLTGDPAGVDLSFRQLIIRKLMDLGSGDGDPLLWLQYIRDVDAQYLNEIVSRLVTLGRFTKSFGDVLRDIAFKSSVNGEPEKRQDVEKFLRELADEEVVINLIKLTALRRTVVLCLDNLETLVADSSTLSWAHPFWSLLQNQLFNTRNLVVVSGMTTTAFQRSTDVIPRDTFRLLSSAGTYTLVSPEHHVLLRILSERLSLVQRAIGAEDHWDSIQQRVLTLNRPTVGTAISCANDYWRSVYNQEELPRELKRKDQKSRLHIDRDEQAAATVGWTFDDDLLHQIRVETDEVRQILLAALDSADSEPPTFVSPPLPSRQCFQSESNSLRSQEAPGQLHQFIEIALTRDEWRANDLASHARQCGLMPGAAIQMVNDWSIETNGDLLLLEERDQIFVQRHRRPA